MVALLQLGARELAVLVLDHPVHLERLRDHRRHQPEVTLRRRIVARLAELQIDGQCSHRLAVERDRHADEGQLGQSAPAAAGVPALALGA